MPLPREPRPTHQPPEPTGTLNPRRETHHALPLLRPKSRTPPVRHHGPRRRPLPPGGQARSPSSNSASNKTAPGPTGKPSTAMAGANSPGTPAPSSSRISGHRRPDDAGENRKTRAAQATGSMTKGGRASWILAIVAHILAWVAYLVAIGLVLWPYLKGERGEDSVVLATVFVPVALTGLALLTVLAARRNRNLSLLAASEKVVPILLALMAAWPSMPSAGFICRSGRNDYRFRIAGIALGPIDHRWKDRAGVLVSHLRKVLALFSSILV